MRGYRKISDGYIDITIDEATDYETSLEDNMIKDVNHAVTSPILDHARESGVLEYMVVVYAKRPERASP